MKDELSDMNEIREYLSHIWRKDTVNKWSDVSKTDFLI